MNSWKFVRVKSWWLVLKFYLQDNCAFLIKMHSYLRRPFWKVTDEIPHYAANWNTVETIYSNCNHSLTCKLQNTQYEGSYFEVSVEICQDWRLTQWFLGDLEEIQLVYESKEPQIIIGGIYSHWKVLFWNWQPATSSKLVFLLSKTLMGYKSS